MDDNKEANPLSWQGLVALAMVCATIVAIVWLIVNALS